MLGCACAALALSACTGAASAAVPNGPFTMSVNALPGGSSVKFEFAPNLAISCQGSNVTGTHQAGVVGKLPWTVEHMVFNYCKFSLGEVAVTVPKMPKMTVTKTATEATRVTFTEFFPVVKFYGCEARLGGAVYGEGPGDPTNSESFTAKTSVLTVQSVTPGCSSLFHVGETAPMLVNYGSTPIGF
jgi:hypothetical protein